MKYLINLNRIIIQVVNELQRATAIDAIVRQNLDFAPELAVLRTGHLQLCDGIRYIWVQEDHG